VTWHAQDALGDIVFFQPPEIGADVVAGNSYGELESVKAVSDIIAPLDGTVVAVNDEVVSTPELVNGDPYAAWLVRVQLRDADQASELLDAAAYQGLLDS
jgi:glycine cleavage system H protein